MPKFRENRKVSKKCLNFMAYVREVVFHLPRVMIHNINSTDLGSYHIEGFQDWCMYSRNNHMLEITTWDEKPCTLFRPNNCFGHSINPLSISFLDSN